MQRTHSGEELSAAVPLCHKQRMRLQLAPTIRHGLAVTIHRFTAPPSALSGAQSLLKNGQAGIIEQEGCCDALPKLPLRSFKLGWCRMLKGSRRGDLGNIRFHQTFS